MPTLSQVGINPLFINIYLHELDKFMEQMAKSLEIKNSDGVRFTSTMNSYKIQYVRYTNDFLIGITGGKETAFFIRDKINNFLQQRLKLTLDTCPTEVIHAFDHVPFLGYLYSRYRTEYDEKNTLKWTSSQSKLIVDLKQIKEELKKENFCDGAGKPLPCFRYTHLSQQQSVNKVRLILEKLDSH
jgi:hypothetical protein